jgi:hypothetical protein
MTKIVKKGNCGDCVSVFFDRLGMLLEIGTPHEVSEYHLSEIGSPNAMSESRVL